MEHNYHYESVKGLIRSAESELITAYRKGYDDAMRDHRKEKNENHMALTEEMKIELAKQYARGANDAWNLVSRIILDNGNRLTGTQLTDIFGSQFIHSIVRQNTGESALHKVIEYFENKKELQVGDVVICLSDAGKKDRYEVFSISEDGKYATILGLDTYDWVMNIPVTHLMFTGERCDVLEKIKDLFIGNETTFSTTNK